MSRNHAYLVAAFLCMAGSLDAAGAALRPNKATDTSVCDLGPDTTAVLGRKLWVPTEINIELQAEAYVRLASRFVTANCAQGQLLILHSPDSSRLDSKALPEVAARLCVMADVARSAVTSRSAVSDEELVGFELRCRIAKLDEFKASFEASEKSDPTDHFIGRLQKQHDPGRAVGGEAADKNDCGKMTLSSILAGGNCR